MNVELELPLGQQAERQAEPEDEAIARELARSEKTLAVLRRLRVPESAELPVAFVFESAGTEADRALASQLVRETGYRVTVEPAGVSGVTTPIEMSASALEKWVGRMVRTGAMNGCAFGGWIVAVSRV